MAGDVVTVQQQSKPSRIAELRRRDLIDAAIRDIATLGYDAVTVATICERAGFSRGLIGHYFAIWRDYRTGIGRLFSRAAQDRGIVLDPDRTALSFSQLVEGFWVGWAADPQAIAPEKAAACCHAYVDMVLDRGACQTGETAAG